MLCGINEEVQVTPFEKALTRSDRREAAVNCAALADCQCLLSSSDLARVTSSHDSHLVDAGIGNPAMIGAMIRGSVRGLKGDLI
jgi:hypothetical protein